MKPLLRKIKFSILFLVSVLNLNQTLLAKIINLKDLDLNINENIRREQNNFSNQIQSTVNKINSSGAIIAIAPAGGSKITPFKQLNLHGLIIVDWLKTGSPQEVIDAFSLPQQRVKLDKAVNEGLINGSMNSNSVMGVSLSAQILARLRYELNATNIVMSYWLAKKDRLSLELNNITIDESLWTHGLVTNSDPVLLTVYSFDMQSGRKVLILLSSLITSDNNQTRPALPFEPLKNLSSIPYTWLYQSADGLFFFSQYDNNGLQSASKQLLAMLKPGGGVILDYPTFSYYTNSCENYDGIIAMCGRKDLTAYGLNLLQNIAVTSPFVFGYCGVSTDQSDSVKIFRKPDLNSLNNYLNTTNQLFDFSKFAQVGENYQIEFRSEPRAGLSA